MNLNIVDSETQSVIKHCVFKLTDREAVDSDNVVGTETVWSDVSRYIALIGASFLASAAHILNGYEPSVTVTLIVGYFSSIVCNYIHFENHNSNLKQVVVVLKSRPLGYWPLFLP